MLEIYEHTKQVMKDYIKKDYMAFYRFNEPSMERFFRTFDLKHYDVDCIFFKLNQDQIEGEYRLKKIDGIKLIIQNLQTKRSKTIHSNALSIVLYRFTKKPNILDSKLYKEYNTIKEDPNNKSDDYPQDAVIQFDSEEPLDLIPAFI